MKIVATAILLAMLLTPSTWAANDSREKQMLRRVQQQAQRAEQEKASVLAEKEALAQQYQQAQSEVDSAKRQTKSVRAEKSSLNKELEEIQKELIALKARLEITDKLLSDSLVLQETTAQNLQATETAKKHTEAALHEKNQNLQVCQEYNGRLYGIGRDLMVKYQEKSCKDSMLQAEPFTGLKKVEVENLLQTWRDKLDREKLPSNRY